MTWLLFFSINFLIFFGAYRGASYLNRQRPSLCDTLLVAGLLYFAQITVSLLLLGFLSLLNTWAVFLLNLGISTIAIVSFRSYTQPFGRPLHAWYNDVSLKKDPVLILLLVLLAVELLIILCQILVLPPLVWDVLTYHLTLMVEWFQQGKIVHAIPTAVSRINSMTMGLPVLSLWYFLFLEDDILVELPQFLWSVMLLLTAYSFLRRTGLTRSWSVKFAALVFFIPGVLISASTVKDHTALNTSLLVALLFAYDFLRTRDHSRLLIVGLATGLGLGYKNVGIVYVLVVWGVMLLCLLLQDRQELTESGKRNKLGVFALAANGIALTIGGYWYIRNLLLYGRLQGSFSYKSFKFSESTLSETFHHRVDVFQANATNFLERILDYSRNYSFDMRDISGFGPQFLCLGLPVLLWMLLFSWRSEVRNKPESLLIYTCLVLMAFYSVLYFSPFNYRIYTFIPMITILIAGFLFREWDVLHLRGWRIMLNLVVSVCVLWSFSATLVPNSIGFRALPSYLVLPRSKQTTASILNLVDDRRQPYQFIARYLSPEESLGYIGHGDSWSYIYYDTNWRRRLFFLDPAVYFTQEADVLKPTPLLKPFLEKQGIRTISLTFNNRVFQLADPEFVPLHEGLFYYQGNKYE